jgi:DNA repair protein RecO (recombination protein O)
MRWQDKGYLLSLNKYNENSAIAEFFTENKGKISGVIFGATSKKIKSYLFIGNKFHINFNSKHEDKLGYFKVEVDEVNTPVFLDNKKKLFCILYTMNLVKILTAENQENKKIYSLLIDFFKLLANDDWLIQFIFWELNFYRCIGYDINFKNYVKSIIIDGNEKFIVVSNNKVDLINGFNIVGDFLEKTILKPNNINFPLSRIEFGNLIKLI